MRPINETDNNSIFNARFCKLYFNFKNFWQTQKTFCKKAKVRLTNRINTARFSG